MAPDCQAAGSPASLEFDIFHYLVSGHRRPKELLDSALVQRLIMMGWNGYWRYIGPEVGAQSCCFNSCTYKSFASILFGHAMDREKAFKQW
jgi:hypothetical protein